MILIDFAEEDGLVRLNIRGHSGYSSSGSDIVCAAVSALAQTFAGGVESVLSGSVNGRLEKGECNLRVSVSAAKSEMLSELLKVFRFGFRKIAKAYPEHVKLI